jgi:hypothetical protein
MRQRTFWQGSAVLLSFAGALLMVAGCSSDSTAPNDDLPPVSQEEAATQAGVLSSLMTQFMGEYYDFLSSKDIYTHSFGFVPMDDVRGTFTLDFQCDGSPCSKDDEDANYVHIYTDADEAQKVKAYLPGEAMPLATLTFDLEVDPYDNTPGSQNGTINGSGSLAAGEYSSSFVVEDVIMSTADYPPSGSVTYTAGAYEVRVEFDGTSLADLYIGGELYCQVDLDTGDLVFPPL